MHEANQQLLPGQEGQQVALPETVAPVGDVIPADHPPVAKAVSDLPDFIDRKELERRVELLAKENKYIQNCKKYITCVERAIERKMNAMRISEARKMGAEHGEKFRLHWSKIIKLSKRKQLKKLYPKKAKRKPLPKIKPIYSEKLKAIGKALRFRMKLKWRLGQSEATKNYWAGMTPAQRKAEGQRRAKLRAERYKNLPPKKGTVAKVLKNHKLSESMKKFWADRKAAQQINEHTP